MQHVLSTCPVAHPAGQLQLELDGVPPLTHIELVELRLYGAPESAATVLDGLELADHATRAARAARLAIVRDVQRPYNSEHGWLFVGGEEAVWLYDEGLRTFVNGEHLAALLCLHSACERAVAAAVSMDAPELADKIKRWGLGPLGDEALKRDLISRQMHEDLKSVTSKRNATAHFRQLFDERSIAFRTLYGDSSAQNYDVTVAEDAEEAARVATALLGGGIGMGGAIGLRSR